MKRARTIIPALLLALSSGAQAESDAPAYDVSLIIEYGSPRPMLNMASFPPLCQ